MPEPLRKIGAALIGGIALLVHLPAAQVTPYDLVLRNGRIIDGTGNPWYRGDVALRGDTIVRMAPAIDDAAVRVIDVQDRAIAPGFIDIHSHVTPGIFEVPTADNYVKQGVTTLIGGPDGTSPVPLAPHLARLESLLTTVNLGSFVGQGSIRSAVMGESNRPPTAGDLEQMRRLVEQAMSDGAFGLSSGLFYVPGTFSSADEVVELATVARRFGGLYISHLRDEAANVVKSVRETIEVGARAGLPIQVTHHKIIGTANWGASVETLRIIDEARQRGIDATMDVYPYTASSRRIQAALFPAWAQEGGREQVLSRLADSSTRERLKADIVHLLLNERGGGDPSKVVVSRCEWDETLAGKTLADIARMHGAEPTISNAADEVLWIAERGDCQGIFHAIGEEDLERILRHPASMIGSDGQVVAFGRAHPHPRSYGTFARVLGVYARERRTVSLEEAVRKMTAFPAQRLGLPDRGLLRPGMKADVAVFDPARVRDTATFDRPHRYAEGFSHVVVNGQLVLEHETMTLARPGRVLRRGR